MNEFVANFVDLSRVSGYDITKEPEYTELQRGIYSSPLISSLFLLIFSALGDPNEYVLALKSVAPENRKKGVAFYLIILPDKGRHCISHTTIEEINHTFRCRAICTYQVSE